MKLMKLTEDHGIITGRNNLIEHSSFVSSTRAFELRTATFRFDRLDRSPERVTCGMESTVSLSTIEVGEQLQ